VYFFPFLCAMLCPKFDSFCIMHVTGMDDDVDRHVTCYASVRRKREERRLTCRMAREAEVGEAAEGVFQAPRRRAGRPRRVVVEDKPRPQADPYYEHMDVDHHADDDAEAMEEDVEEDAQQQRRRRKGKKVVLPDLDPPNDYPSGPHDLTLLTRYHMHVTRKASEGVVSINVIFYEIDVNLGETDVNVV